MHKTTCMVIQPLTMLLFVFVILELLQHALCAQTNFTKRGVTADDILNFRGAMLVKNGVETTCEFALIDNQAAFMAASCLDFNNGEVDSSTQYAIYFDQSMGNTPTNTAISANNIHIHPQYNPTTFANNVAIVEYNFTEQGNWTNYFAVYSSEWVSNVFVRRRLTSANSQIWREPFVNSYNNAGKLCSARSPLYSQNTYDMRCNQIQTNNSWNNTCPMPYGTVYGALTESLAIAGLYSHSYMFGQNFCSGTRGLYFFTMLMHYIEWGESVIGRQINKLVEDTSGYASMSKSASFSMHDVSSPNPGNMYEFSGDLKAPKALEISVQTSSAALSPAPSSPTSTTDGSSQITSVTSKVVNNDNISNNNDNIGDGSKIADDSEDGGDEGSAGGSAQYINPAEHTSLFTNPIDSMKPSDTASAAGGNNETHSEQNKPVSGSYYGMSKGAIIGVAVSVPLIFILLVVASYFVYKRWKGGEILSISWKKLSRKHQSATRELVEEIGGASEVEQLPSYDELEHFPRESMLSAPRSLSALPRFSMLSLENRFG